MELLGVIDLLSVRIGVANSGLDIGESIGDGISGFAIGVTKISMLMLFRTDALLSSGACATEVWRAKASSYFLFLFR